MALPKWLGLVTVVSLVFFVSVFISSPPSAPAPGLVNGFLALFDDEGVIAASAAGGDPNIDLANTLSKHGGDLFRMRQFAEARAKHMDALRMHTVALGPAHLYVAISLHNIAFDA